MKEATRITNAWDALGIRWTDETADTEVHRQDYKLPAGLRIGRVLLGPGYCHHFFDEAGVYVGYGAIDASETEYFVERGNDTECLVGYHLDRDVYEVRLEGRYAGVPKVHSLFGNARLLRYFHGLPAKVGNIPYQGAADLVEGDVLEVRDAVGDLAKNSATYRRSQTWQNAFAS